MSDWSQPPSGNSPGFIDRAETFAESNVSLGQNSTSLSVEHVELGTSRTGNVTTRDADTGTYSFTTEGRGGQINPNTDLSGVYGELSANTGTPTEARLTDSGGNTLATDSIDGGSFKLEADLTAGTNYHVVVGSGGAEVTWGEGPGNYPYAGTDLDITDGSIYSSEGDVGTAGLVYAIQNLEGLENATSGSATVEWPHPPDVYGWDTATFQRTLDGETVAVYIEESTDGGATWTEVAGPISRGDEIPADPSSEVRFRVDLDRTDTANNPTLDAVYRRYTV